jgi:hypothetical protein
VRYLLRRVLSWLRRTPSQPRSSTSTILQRSPYTGRNSDSGSTLSTVANEGLDGTRVVPSWYEVIEGSRLEQGDVLPGIVTSRALADSSVEGGYRIRVGSGDYVVLSQTCDLENDKVGEVLLATFRSYQDLAHEVGAMARSTAFRDALIRCSDFAYFLLHDFDGPPNLAWSVVDFHHLRLTDVATCRQQADELGPRLRMTPPYKENLAQCFGRYMMRVALPETAHAFKRVAYVPPVVPKKR